MPAASASTVSVVIPTYNQQQWVGEAIESAAAQTAPPIEIIVVDDGSTDDTPHVLAAFAEREHVAVIRKANGGVAAARNTGAAVATGDYLAFLDSDDVWLPTKLEQQLERFDRDPRIGLVHCGIQHIDAAGNTLHVRLDGLEGDVLDEFLLLRRAVVLAGSSTMVVPRAIFENVGGYDESLAVSADWDLAVRIARTLRIGFVAEPLVRYRLHGSNMTQRVDIFARDMERALEKAHMATPDLRHLHRRSRAQLALWLAGTSLDAGQRWLSLRHVVRAWLFHPRTASASLAVPFRRARRLAGRRS